MMLTTLRQQGGAAILTVPMSILQQIGWQIGNKIQLEMQGDSVLLTPEKRKPRGRKNLTELLNGIDSEEIAQLNAEVVAFQSEPTGKEVW